VKPTTAEGIVPIEDLNLRDRIVYLGRIDLFQGLAVSELLAVATVTEERSYPAGAVVMESCETCAGLHLIVEGEVMAERRMEGSDCPTLKVARFGPGESFGELALFGEMPGGVQVKALTDVSLLILDKREFDAVVREYPEIALRVCRRLSQRIRMLLDRIQECEACRCRLEEAVNAPLLTTLTDGAGA